MTDAQPVTDTVWQLLEQRFAATPDAVAFQRETGDGHWDPLTWQAFHTRVTRLRRGLYAAGLRKGDRLALIAPVSIEWELLHHAALSMGVVVVGLDAHDLPQRIASMALQAGVVAFATTDARTLALLDEEQWGKVRVLVALPNQKARAELPAGKRFIPWAELDALADTSDAMAERPRSEDLATIIFTSGTTGAPKGIAYTHAQVCMAVAAIAEAFSFVGHDGRLLCWLPLSNLFQRMVNLAGMRQGAGTYLLGDPRRVMAVVASVSPDIFVGVPRFYEKLYDGIRESIAARSALQRRAINLAWRIGRRVSQHRLDKRPVPAWLAVAHRAADTIVLSRLRGVMGARLRCMVTGSAPTPRYLLDEFHALGWLLLEAYGMSENVMPMAMNRVDDFRFGTVGRPLPGNQIAVGEGGGIKVKGSGLFSGYLGDAGPLPVDSEGFYATWDLGEIDSDGYLRLTGRTGDLIKTSAGRRIAPAPIEAQLRRMPGIDDVVLIGNGRKYLVALCSCPEFVPDESALIEFKRSISLYLSDINEQSRPLGFGLILRKFSIESDEITPNLKIRRNVISSRYQVLIDQLYQAVESMPRQQDVCVVVTDPG
jgi:long-chain acyl-CoA synthetase